LGTGEYHNNKVYSAKVSKQSLCLHRRSAHIMHLTDKFARSTCTDSIQRVSVNRTMSYDFVWMCFNFTHQYRDVLCCFLPSSDHTASHKLVTRWGSVSKTTACCGSRGRIWRNQQVRVSAGKAHSSPSHMDVSPQRAKKIFQMERKCQQCLQTTSPLLAADKTCTITSTISSTILCVHVFFSVSIWFEPTYVSV